MDHQVFHKLWNSFKNQKNLGMASPNAGKVETERMENFADTIRDIIAHNKKGLSYRMGLNKFSDLSEQEFKDYFHLKENTVRAEQHCSATDQRQSVRKVGEPDVAYDWREHQGVSPVKNQGSCGSCWTFSTVGCLEAHSLIKYGSFDSLAEQQLVDCAQAFDNHGCNGGLPSHAFEYIA
jgi:cathepsin H